MVIKDLDSNLNLDERFRLTKREKVRMKKEEKKKSRQTQDSTNRVCCLTLSADVVVQLLKKEKEKKAFQAQNRIKQPAVESGYTITMAYIHSRPQHTSFYLKERRGRE